MPSGWPLTHQILLLGGEFKLVRLVSELRFPPRRRADPTDPVPLGVRPDGRDVLQRLGELRRRGVVARRLVDPLQGGVAGQVALHLASATCGVVQPARSCPINALPMMGV